MRATVVGIKSDIGDPSLYYSGVLPCRQMSYDLILPGNRKSEPDKVALSIQAVIASRDCSVIPDCTGLPVFCCWAMARQATTLDFEISLTRIFTRSLPRSLLSIARLKKARSR